MASPRFWNSLPLNIRSAQMLEHFKLLLKTHFYVVPFSTHQPKYFGFNNLSFCCCFNTSFLTCCIFSLLYFTTTLLCILFVKHITPCAHSGMSSCQTGSPADCATSAPGIGHCSVTKGKLAYCIYK